MNNNWKRLKISDFAEIIMGQSPESKYYNNNGIGVPFLQGNRTFGGLYPTIDTWCTNPIKLARKNSVLMSVRAPVGDTNIADQEICIGRGLSSLSMKKGNNKFLFYLIKANKSKILANEAGTVFGAINKNVLSNIYLSITTNIDEQNTISSFLCNLDSKIEINLNISKNLEELAQTLYKRWFVDFEFPNEKGEPYKSSGVETVDSELGLIPKGWEVKQIGEVFETVLGGTPSRSKKEFWGEGHQWLKSGELNNYRITRGTETITDLGLNSSATKLMPVGTTLIAITGYVGLVSMLEIEACANQSVVGIIPNSNYPRSFLYSMIKNDIERISSKQTGSAQQHINKNDINSHKFISPNLSIIKKFDATVENIHKKIAVILFESEKLAELRDLLLPKLMSGEIEVPIEE
jgi:type I restriction enzyme S subunit